MYLYVPEFVGVVYQMTWLMLGVALIGLALLGMYPETEDFPIYQLFVAWMYMTTTVWWLVASS